MKKQGIVKYDFYKTSIMMALVSFLGFAVENVWLAATKGYMNNRNMNLPFLLGYGMAVIAVYLLFGVPSNMLLLTKYKVKAPCAVKILVYFLCVMLCISLGEILIGTITEKLCGIEYWNYSNLPVHITKYTSIPTSVGLSAIGTLFMEKIFPPVMEKLGETDSCAIRVVAVVLLVLMVGDFLYCYGKMIRRQSLNEMWRWQITR